jgi:Sulfotransferase family
VDRDNGFSAYTQTSVSELSRDWERLAGNPLSPVFFFHIPKTGGTTVVNAVRTALGSGCTANLYDVSGADWFSPRLIDRVNRIASRGRHRFLCGHISPASIPHSVPVRRAVMLRNPLDRLLSNFCYCYEQRHKSAQDFSFFLERDRCDRKTFDNGDLVAWLKRNSADNYLTRLLTGQMDGPLTARHAAAAIRQLEAMDIIGFTEDMEDFLAVLANALATEPMPERHANRSSRTLLSMSESQLRAFADSHLALDFEVFSAAKKLASAFQSDKAAPLDRQRLHFPSTAAMSPAFQDLTMRKILISARARIVPRIRRLHEQVLLASRKFNRPDESVEWESGAAN